MSNFLLLHFNSKNCRRLRKTSMPFILVVVIRQWLDVKWMSNKCKSFVFFFLRHVMKKNDDKRRSTLSFQLDFQRRKRIDESICVFFSSVWLVFLLLKGIECISMTLKEGKERITVESKQIQQMTIRTYVGLESLSGNNDEKQIDKWRTINYMTISD